LALFHFGACPEMKLIIHPYFPNSRICYILIPYFCTLLFSEMCTLLFSDHTSQGDDPTEVFKFTPDGKSFVTGISGGNIDVWDWRQKKLIRTLEGDLYSLSSIDDIAFSNNNELLSACGDRSVKIWGLKNGDLKMVIGDGLFQTKLTGFLSIIILLTLVFGFCGILINPRNKYSSFAIVSILSVWSFGILLFLFFF